MTPQQATALATRLAEERENFLHDPMCRICHCHMELNEDAEWPEDPRLWVCNGCASALLEDAYNELTEALKWRDSYGNQLEDMQKLAEQNGYGLDAANAKLAAATIERDEWREMAKDGAELLRRLRKGGHFPSHGTFAEDYINDFNGIQKGYEALVKKEGGKV